MIEKQRLALEFQQEQSGIHELGSGWLAIRADGLFRLTPPAGTSLPEQLNMAYTSAQRAKEALHSYKEKTNG